MVPLTLFLLGLALPFFDAPPRPDDPDDLAPRDSPAGNRATLPGAADADAPPAAAPGSPLPRDVALGITGLLSEAKGGGRYH
ncbi:MAG: hypothetical protein KY441_04450, partial [Actinobacteria bacterium]|nr:hypothetical protein [Actinomycetota bacterium]